MSLAHLFIAEITHEASNTQKMLERVPAGKFGWKPHEKSMTLKHLSAHIANLSGWAGFVADTEYLDLADNNLPIPEINNTEDLLQLLRRNVAASVQALESKSDKQLSEPWILRNGARIILEMPKAAVIRGMCMSHIYHHRGQLSVYLRLLDVPVPGMYGPSIDDPVHPED